MGTGEAVGTRSLVDGLTTKAYCNAKAQAGFVLENFSGFKLSELDSLLNTVDEQSAKYQTTRFRLEHTDAFALRRDMHYAMRSRKWFLVRAQQSRLDRSFAGWKTFVTKNTDHPTILEKLTDQNAEQLKGYTFNAVVVPDNTVVFPNNPTTVPVLTNIT